MAFNMNTDTDVVFKESNDNAILRIKFDSQFGYIESIPFEELVNRSDCYVRIDFPDGHSLMEHNYKYISLPEERFFVEFFDSYTRKSLISYFSKESSNYRVTDSSGTVIRLALHDFYGTLDEERKVVKRNTSKQIIENELNAFYDDIHMIQNILLKIIKKKDK